MAAENSRVDSFKIPASSLDEIFKILQGYANIGKAASLADVSKQTGMHTTVVSRNVGFLLSLGILEGGKNKAATKIGAELGLALMHNLEQEVRSILNGIVAENEFLKSVLAAVRIRRGMDISGLRSHIAYSAGQSKTGSTATGTGAVIELLKRSGNLEDEDGKLVVSTQPASGLSTEGQAEKATSEVQITQSAFSQPIKLAMPSSNTPFSINIEIKVSCGPDDLETLGKKIRKVIEDFSEEDNSIDEKI